VTRNDVPRAFRLPPFTSSTTPRPSPPIPQKYSCHRKLTTSPAPSLAEDQAPTIGVSFCILKRCSAPSPRALSAIVRSCNMISQQRQGIPTRAALSQNAGGHEDGIITPPGKAISCFLVRASCNPADRNLRFGWTASCLRTARLPGYPHLTDGPLAHSSYPSPPTPGWQARARPRKALPSDPALIIEGGFGKPAMVEPLLGSDRPPCDRLQQPSRRVLVCHGRHPHRMTWRWSCSMICPLFDINPWYRRYHGCERIWRAAGC
jgi:hypothetical protein